MKSAIILVGGEATRAGGMEKYFFRFKGKTFIERLIDTVRGTVDEILLVTKSEEQCKRFAHFSPVICVPDIRKGTGPIGGIHAGVLHAKGDLVFIAACDMPCINRNVIEFLFSRINDHDAIIPCWDHDRLEPLHAVYRREVLLRYLATHTSLSLRDMVRHLDAHYVSVEDLRKMDPSLSTFTNINRIEDLACIPETEREPDSQLDYFRK
ncbi:MAG: molybdenum cofactor guanylyltransferase [Methanomicrobiales archaeon]|nr:molybdenum cofactor guanylyltransferase [Methanomicrobiales archaeon]